MTVSRRQEIRNKQRRQERLNRVLAIVGISAVAILIAAVMIIPTLPRAVGEILTAEPITRPQANFNTMGDPNAPVKIIEYADFQCPFCLRFFADTEKQIIDTYIATGKVYFEYRSFGAFIGAESAQAAEAAYCAGDQGKFWEMHDLIYTNQGAENSSAFRDDRLRAFGETLKLDTTKYNDCFNNDKQKQRVTQDGLDAQAAGITSTPSFLINGKLIQGAQPFSTFQAEIDAALAAAGK